MKTFTLQVTGTISGVGKTPPEIAVEVQKALATVNEAGRALLKALPGNAAVQRASLVVEDQGGHHRAAEGYDLTAERKTVAVAFPDGQAKPA